MQAATAHAGKQFAQRGIKVRTADGLRPAKVTEEDQAIALDTAEGDANGFIENVTTYTEDGIEGTQFDVVIRGNTNSASLLTLTVDADPDAGEIRKLQEEYNFTQLAEEAGSFSFPAGNEEDLPAGGGEEGGV